MVKLILENYKGETKMKNKNIDFITKKHSSEMNLEVASELTNFDNLDYYNFEDEFESLENKFVGGTTTKQTLSIFKNKL